MDDNDTYENIAVESESLNNNNTTTNANVMVLQHKIPRAERRNNEKQ